MFSTLNRIHNTSVTPFNGGERECPACKLNIPIKKKRTLQLCDKKGKLINKYIEVDESSVVAINLKKLIKEN